MWRHVAWLGGTNVSEKLSDSIFMVRQPSDPQVVGSNQSPWLRGLLLNTEYGGITLFQKIGEILPDYTASYPRLW
jgi:hypothetical protein